LSLAPGESKDYLFGTFTPIGDAPAGTYTFFDAGLTFIFDGTDLNGDAITTTATAAETCTGDDPACGFSRVIHADAVTGTPEPATFGLIGMGLGFVGLARRHRNRRAAA